MSFRQLLQKFFDLNENPSAFNHWNYSLIDRIQDFCRDVSVTVTKAAHRNPSVLIIYAEDPTPNHQSVDSLSVVLESVLNLAGIIKVERLNLKHGSNQHLNKHLEQFTTALILISPTFAQITSEHPSIKQDLDAFGNQRDDALQSLLCAGGFVDTAFNVVGRNFLIRAFQELLAPVQDPVVPLQIFREVIFNFSGSRGLGLLPDLLNLERTESAHEKEQYLKIYHQFEEAEKEICNEFRLRHNLEIVVQESKSLKKSLNVKVPKLQVFSDVLDGISQREKNPTTTFLLLCRQSAESWFSIYTFEKKFLKDNVLTLPIDCSQYPGSTAHQCVHLELTKLKFTDAHLKLLKKRPIVILFKNYDQIGTYDNLYVKNRLGTWSSVKTIVSCRGDFFQFRDYQSSFLNDPLNPQLASLQTFEVASFIKKYDIEQKVEELLQKRKSDAKIAFQETSGALEHLISPKIQAQKLELVQFLKEVKKLCVERGILLEEIEKNPQTFISYAWEAEKQSLIRQQAHLLRIVRDLSNVGISTWLDIERMTGNIDAQMAGNIRASSYVLMIGTPRYTQRASEPTNVQKEFREILERQKQNKLKVFALLFSGQNTEGFPADMHQHQDMFDFREIDKGEVYIERFIDLKHGLLPRILALTQETDEAKQYEALKEKLTRELEFLPAKHIIVDKGQDAIQAFDIDNRLKGYIHPHGLFEQHQKLESRFPVIKHFSEFLEQPEVKTYTLLGGAGSGKSLFTLFTVKNFLQQWYQWRSDPDPNKSPPKWLPIYIPLKSYAREKPEEIVHLCLKEFFKLEDGDIENLRTGLGRNQGVLFILDGYDELGATNRPNFPILFHNWPHSKLLISGRPDHFHTDDDLLHCFGLTDQIGVHQKNSFQVTYISPFSPEEINQYIDEFEKRTNTTGTQADLKAIPGLWSLLDNPFSLNLVLQSLPLLKSRQNKKRPITRSDIYKSFVDTVFMKETNKQKDILETSDFDMKHCYDYAETLAFEMFRSGAAQITPEQKVLWDEFFSKPEHLPLRQVCPLRRAADEYSFIHKSVFEYFVALWLWGALSEDLAKRQDLWNRVSITEEKAVIEFLVEFSRIKRSFDIFETSAENVKVVKPRLLELVYSSRFDPSYTRAAANAITVLNSMQFSFSELEFKNIFIGGADLTGAVCDGTNFSGSDLSGVKLTGAWLRNAHFEGTIMRDVMFGEWPNITLKQSCKSCLLSPSGRFLAYAIGNDVQVLVTATRKPLFQDLLTGHGDCVSGLSFNKDETLLASGSWDNSIKIWDLETGKLVKTLNGHTWELTAVAFSPNGKYFASASKDRDIFFWNLETGIVEKKLTGHASSVFALAFNPRGDRLASGGGDRSIRLWDPESATMIKNISAGCQRVMALNWSPDGQWLASGGYESNVRIWNPETGEEWKAFEGHRGFITGVSFQADGKILASSSADKTVRLWSVDRAEQVKIFEGHKKDIVGVQFHPSGEQLISYSSMEAIRFWKIQKRGADVDFTSQGHVGPIQSVDYSVDGNQVASGGFDEIVRIWDSQSGELIQKLEGHTNLIRAVKYSPDGKILASSSDDKTIRLWNVDGTLNKVLKGEQSFTLAFSLDAKVLLTGNSQSTISFWNVETGEKLGGEEYDPARFVHPGFPLPIIFNHRGDKFVSGCSDGKLRLWNYETKQMEKVILQHSTNVTNLDFSYDDSIFVSSSLSSEVKLVRLTDGKHASVDNHPFAVSAAKFTTPDAKFLISTDLEENLEFTSVKKILTSTQDEPATGVRLKLTSFTHDFALPPVSVASPSSAFYEFVSGQHDGSLTKFRVTVKRSGEKDEEKDEDDQVEFVLEWSTRQKVLTTTKANFSNVKELSSLNSELLAQNGAEHLPPPPPPLS